MRRATLLLLSLVFLVNTSILSQTISVDFDTRHQTIIGFGGHNPNGQVDMLVNDMGMSIQRCWLAPEFEPSNDNTNPNSANAGNFYFDNSTNTSKSDLIALKNAGVKYFMATPWSPPSWMKDNNSHIDGGHVRENSYPELVEFFIQFIKEFETEIGIPLYAVSIQNEPRFAQSFYSCVYTPQEMREVVRLLGRRLEEENLDTKIIIAEDMGSIIHFTPWFSTIVTNDEETREMVDIFAVHGYQDGVTASGNAKGWEDMYNYCKDYDMPLWMTETSGYNVLGWEEGHIDVGSESGTKPGAIDLATHIFWALKYGKISSWIWWRINIRNDQTSFWIDECLSHGTTKTKAYYASKQFYKYIRPGAVHVNTSTTDDDVDAIAFTNPDEGQFTVLLINQASASKTVNLDFGTVSAPGSFDVYRSSSSENCEFISAVSNNSFNLPGRSVTSLFYTGTNKAPTLDEIESVNVLHNAGQQSINLKGITDGGEGGQTISISAISSNPSVIPNPTINYTSPGATGTLLFTPQQGSSGNVTITVTIEDDGDDVAMINRRVIEFDVNVLPFVNAAPTLDPVDDITAYIDDGQVMIELTGLTDGNDGSQVLTITSEAAVPQALQIAAVQDENKILFYYNPILKGDIPVTINIKDDGGILMGGENSKKVTFTVMIKEGSNPDPGPDPVKIERKTVQAMIYPNPVVDFLYIKNLDNQFINLEIVDVSGKTMMKKQLTDDTKFNKMNLGHLPKGIYCLRLRGNGEVFKSIFIKQ